MKITPAVLAVLLAVPPLSRAQSVGAETHPGDTATPRTERPADIRRSKESRKARKEREKRERERREAQRPRGEGAAVEVEPDGGRPTTREKRGERRGGQGEQTPDAGAPTY